MRRPESPPSETNLFAEAPDRLAEIFSVIVGPTVDGRYRHWHKLRQLKPPPPLSHAEWWWRIRLARQMISKPIALVDTDGRAFTFALVDPMLEMLSRVDRRASGEIGFADAVTNPTTRDRYILNSLIEEAIRSSQLEGASTTRRVARQMLRSGRKPRDRSERMIVNNLTAMQRVREFQDRPMTPDLVTEIHRIVTRATLDDPNDAGRVRGPDDPIEVAEPGGEWVMHKPPPSDELAERMERMCAFANGNEPGFFVHPVIRAILLHFWLAYDHPFVDGNGRTARALFYWAMLRSGYWMVEYISISAILSAGPARYALAYYYAETDANDATYFVLNQLAVLLRAIDAAHEYLARKLRQLQQTTELVRHSASFNHRQIALIGNAVRDAAASYTVRSHQRSHGVTRQTARVDLVQLHEMGLLTRRQDGRAFVFRPVPRLQSRLEALGRGAPLDGGDEAHS